METLKTGSIIVLYSIISSGSVCKISIMGVYETGNWTLYIGKIVRPFLF